MRDNWMGLLLFGAGVLGGIVLVAMLPGMPWSATAMILALPMPTDQHDLEAQRSMASAAWYMVALTTLSGVIGTAGLYLIWQTLLATQRNAKAAEMTVDETRKIGRAQTRAYLSITQMEVECTEHINDMQLTIRNVGQSPALSVSCTTEISLVEITDGEDDGLPEQKVVETEEYWPDIISTETNYRSILLWDFDPVGYFRRMREGSSLAVIFSVDVRYQDVFGELHTSSITAHHNFENAKEFENPLILEKFY